jgi:putative heme iron utilization protein
VSADGIRPARLLLRRSRTAVLATLSRRFPGYPAGSAVPLAVDAAGRPVLLLSSLAAHTQNLGADVRASLTVHADDVMAGARMCVMGDVLPIDQDSRAAARYLALLPGAAAYAGFGDFRFHRMEPVAVHYIGGFGDIRWFDGSDLPLPASALDEREDDIVGHMNEDHGAAIAAYCRLHHGLEPREARMLCMDGDGFDVQADGRMLRFDFPEPVSDADQARRHLVRMARETG